MHPVLELLSEIFHPFCGVWAQVLNVSSVFRHRPGLQCIRSAVMWFVSLHTRRRATVLHRVPFIYLSCTFSSVHASVAFCFFCR